jgi:hypothetical protein
MTTEKKPEAKTPTQGDRIEALEAEVAAIKEALATGDSTLIAGTFTAKPATAEEAKGDE